MADSDATRRSYGEVDPEAVQQGSGQQVQAKVGVVFTVVLENAKLTDDPGVSWFNSYDQAFLTLVRSGWDVTYDGSNVTWAQFLPKQVGTTVIQGVVQPHLINPLYVQHDFTVTISS